MSVEAPGHEIGGPIKKKVVGRRVARWTRRLREDHALDEATIAELRPFVLYLSHFGSRTELGVLVGLLAPWVGGLVVLLGLGLRNLVEGRSFAVIQVVGVSLLLAPTLYWLRRRYRRYRVARRIRDHLQTDPKRLTEDDDLLPVSHDRIRDREYHVEVSQD